MSVMLSKREITHLLFYCRDDEAIESILKGYCSCCSAGVQRILLPLYSAILLVLFTTKRVRMKTDFEALIFAFASSEDDQRPPTLYCDYGTSVQDCQANFVYRPVCVPSCDLQECRRTVCRWIKTITTAEEKGIYSLYESTAATLARQLDD